VLTLFVAAMAVTLRAADPERKPVASGAAV
jgi:hypothetical protein